MLPPIEHPHIVATDNSFRLESFPSSLSSRKDTAFYKKSYKKNRKKLYQEQQKLYADDRYSLLLIFQAMDAAGKDSTIRHVFRGVNPAGFQVSCFKKPSARELDHDFLWRTSQRLPQRGRIGIFNRSYYEEVLVVRVHPELLGHQQLPNINPSDPSNQKHIWEQRFQSINEHERHLVHNGTIIRKFFLNVSRKEQHQRFLKRLNTPEKQWKFSADDLKESEYWNDYMHAYEECLRQTSTEWAPWYCIPADNKPVMRAMVSEIVLQSLLQLKLDYPSLSPKQSQQLDSCRAQLII